MTFTPAQLLVGASVACVTALLTFVVLTARRRRRMNRWIDRAVALDQTRKEKP